MSLSSISIKRPVFAWILMFGLIFFGILAFQKMGINENPDVDFPTVTVQYAYDGATPAVIEKDIIEPVEGVLVSMEGIRNINSVSERGNARITLEFELDIDIDFALQETQTLLGRAQRQLPDTVPPPTVTKSNAADRPLMYVAFSTETLTMREMMILFRDQVRDRFATIEGVAELRPFGYHEPVLRIDLIARKLRQYDLTAQDIVDSVKREHLELPAGKLEYKDKEETIRVMGEATRVEDFQNLIISRRGGAPNYIPIRLKDVAKVYEGLENIRRISRVNGTFAIGMAVQKQKGVNAVATAKKVKKRIAEVNTELPEGTRLSVNFDTTQFIEESVNELVFTLILSALLTSLVCWIFLGSWSATINILLAIPTAIIGTFIFIEQFGFTLNTFSLLGLALAIGVVVDDAIIMLENIVRYFQMGFDRINAAFKGAREITFAVIATTLALVSIFLPITFMKGIEGRFFFEFAVTISVAVALSSLEALTLAPMRCSQFLSLSERSTVIGRNFEKLMDFLKIKYTSLLNLALRHRIKIVVGSFAIVAVSLFTVKSLKAELVPPQDRGVLFVIFLAPDGKSMEYTNEKVKQFEDIVRAHPDVKRTFVAVGGFGRGGQGNRGNGVVILKPAKEREKNQFEVAQELRTQIKEIKGMRVFLRDRFGGSLGGRRGSPVEFTINGPDPKVQRELYAQMKEEMEATKMMVGIRSDDVRVIPEVQIIPDRERARRSGVEVAEISRIVNATFGGVVAGQYTKDGRRFDIQVQLQEEDREQKEDLRNVLARNNRSELIPLNQVVSVESFKAPQYIYREDRIRGVRVDSDIMKGKTQGEVLTRIREISKRILPEGYYLRFGDTPQSKLFDTIIVMLLGLIVAYMVLASQFNSFMDPFIVFLAIPFGLIGSFFGLLIGGQTLNLFSVIGILLTMGIVKKNSILLVEFTNQLRDQGFQLQEAIKEACPVRLRPILMTTTATIAAAIPPALALGPGAETRIPMALSVIGGVALSTMFTLFVVPCVMSLIAPPRRPIPVESESHKSGASSGNHGSHIGARTDRSLTN